jgi:hypothetical protein
MPPPRHTSPVPVFSGSIGLNNKIAPHRLPYSIESGVGAFEEATNVIIDQTGEPVTRRGYSLLEAGSFHSMIPVDTYFYVAKDRTSDTAIYLASISSISGQINLVGVVSGLTKKLKLSYFRLRDTIFYSNGEQSGMLNGSASSPWPESNFTHETTADMKPFIKGKHISLFAGRALASVGPRLVFSEYNLFGIYDAVRNVREFESDIVLVCPVQTGVFVSTTMAIYFLSGKNPAKWTLDQVTTFPAVEWCKQYDLVKPGDLKSDSVSLAALFGTVKGPAIGLSNGTVQTQIDTNISLNLTCHSPGAIVLHGDTLILQSR